MIANVFWNLVAILTIGGGAALLILAWPFIEKLFYGAGCLLAVVLVVGFIAAHAFSPKRGVWINGVHYEDIWRDD